MAEEKLYKDKSIKCEGTGLDPSRLVEKPNRTISSSSGRPQGSYGIGICPVCKSHIKITSSGKIRKHSSPFEDPKYIVMLSKETYGKVFAAAEISGIDPDEWVQLILEAAALSTVNGGR